MLFSIKEYSKLKEKGLLEKEICHIFNISRKTLYRYKMKEKLKPKAVTNRPTLPVGHHLTWGVISNEPISKYISNI